MRDGAGILAGGQRHRVCLQVAGHAGREPQALRRRGGHRRPGRQAEQDGRAQLVDAPGGAGRAPLDVPVRPPAQRRGQLPVPAGQQRAELAAVVAACAAHEQHGEARLELVAGPGRQRGRLAAGHAEHVRDLGGLQPLPQLQLEDLALGGVQAARGGGEQGTQFGPFGRSLGDVDDGVRHARRHGEPRRGPRRPQDPQAFVARDGVQPGAEPAWIAQLRQPGRGDDERVLDGVGGVGGIAEHGPAVLVERFCVPVVGSGEPAGVSCHDGRDKLAVAREHSVAAPLCARR